MQQKPNYKLRDRAANKIAERFATSDAISRSFGFNIHAGPRATKERARRKSARSNRTPPMSVKQVNEEFIPLVYGGSFKFGGNHD